MELSTPLECENCCTDCAGRGNTWEHVVRTEVLRADSRPPPGSNLTPVVTVPLSALTYDRVYNTHSQPNLQHEHEPADDRGNGV